MKMKKILLFLSLLCLAGEASYGAMFINNSKKNAPNVRFVIRELTDVGSVLHAGGSVPAGPTPMFPVFQALSDETKPRNATILFDARDESGNKNTVRCTGEIPILGEASNADFQSLDQRVKVILNPDPKNPDNVGVCTITH